MSKKKKLLILILSIIISFFLLAAWYQHTYSMDKASAFEINSSTLSKKLVIATQSSDFKDAITKNIINHYKQDSIYIKVIDVEALTEINPKNYNAILLINTWESWQPPQAVKVFVNRTKADKNKIISLTTSGSGTSKMEEVDTLSGESNLGSVESFTNQIIEKLNILLK